MYQRGRWSIRVLNFKGQKLKLGPEQLPHWEKDVLAVNGDQSWAVVLLEVIMDGIQMCK